ncbi:MAG: lipoyl(octanoyl) transferase LipB [Archangium sp.]|nr:lipoyl(octanoyl) transferase LipB [Archangium sp.]
MNPPVQWHRLGRVEYGDGLELQRQFQEARRVDEVPDTLLLLEHPPVLTLGRGAKENNIITPKPQLEALGVEVFETDRGGDVTYHGPGQIVGYPLLHLGAGRQDVRKYVRAIEELMIRTVADWGITATRIEQWPGVWVAESRRGGPRKIAALGVHLSRWYTKHGFALNVRTDLSHFELIVPCGIREAGVTSMRDELERDVPVFEVEDRIVHHFREVFDCEVTAAEEPRRTVSVVVTREDGRVLLLERTAARGGFWQPVTGRVEAGESPLQAAQRELMEETGLESVVVPLDYEHCFPFGEGRPPQVFRETAFMAKARGEVRIDPGEHSACGWFTREEAIAKVPHAGLARAIAMSARPSP